MVNKSDVWAELSQGEAAVGLCGAALTSVMIVYRQTFHLVVL